MLETLRPAVKRDAFQAHTMHRSVILAIQLEIEKNGKQVFQGCARATPLTILPGDVQPVPITRILRHLTTQGRSPSQSTALFQHTAGQWPNASLTLEHTLPENRNPEHQHNSEN